MTSQSWINTVPELPATLSLADRTYTVQHVLRHLPGRRIALHAHNATDDVVLKLFASKNKGKQEFTKELQAYQHCFSAGIMVPPVTSHGTEQSGLNYIAYRYISNAKTLNELEFEQQPLKALFMLFAECHTANCYQQDPHLDNFIYDGKTVFLLDLGSVHCQQKPLGISICLDNIARLIAQWPLEKEAELKSALNVYFEQRKMVIDESLHHQLAQKLKRTRQQRQRHYLKKQLRACTMTYYQRTTTFEVACRRSLLPELTQNPLTTMQQEMVSGQVLKKGNTATVSRNKLANRNVVIKRYNIKNLRHFLSRCWRPSRARNSWLMANLLEYLGIPTPQPLGFIEQRVWRLRATAFFICEHVSGRTLKDLKDDELIEPALLTQLASLFSQLRCHHIYHGDLKATNFIIDPSGKLWLIDLDSMKIHSGKEFTKLHQLDQQRFLRNWSKQEHHQLLSDVIQA